MALKHSAKSLQLLRDGAKPHGKEKFKFDNESIRPSHLDKAVKAIYEDIEAVDSKETGGTSLWLEGTGEGALKQNETCTASAESSIAIGQNTKSLSSYSFAEGVNTEAGSYTAEIINEVVDNIQMVEVDGKYKPAYIPYSSSIGDAFDRDIEEAIADGFAGLEVVLEDVLGNSASWLAKSTYSANIEMFPGFETAVLVIDQADGGPYTSNPGFIFLKREETIPAVDNQAAHSEGIDTKATGKASHAQGILTTASDEGAHSEGKSTTASGKYSHSEGEGTEATGTWAHSEGRNTKASTNSHAEGEKSEATGGRSHAEGYDTRSSGNTSHAEGYQSESSGLISHAEGRGTTASGDYSHTEGQGTIASDSHAHAEGYETTASGFASHSEGRQTAATGPYSHSEGRSTEALGERSHAEGLSTTSSGNNSHAQNSNTVAGGDSSHAGGTASTANGDFSFVHSANSTVNGEYSAIVGGQNIQLDEHDTLAVPDLQIRKSHAIPTSTIDNVGGPGSITWDDDFMYVKTTAGWKRTALVSFGA